MSVIASVALLAVGAAAEAQTTTQSTSVSDTTGSTNAATGPEPSPIPIVSYDISESPISGWGEWAHSYTGTIEDTGRTTGPDCAAAGTHIAGYSNRSGTLNDTVSDEANIDSTHLLCLDVASDGELVRPSSTLEFAEAVLVDRIVIHGGGTGGNIYPGASTRPRS